MEAADSDRPALEPAAEAGAAPMEDGAEKPPERRQLGVRFQPEPPEPTQDGRLSAPALPGQSAVRGLSAEQATQLATEGATLLLMNVPPGTQVGIGLSAYAAGPKFCGIKMIPPGMHLVNYAAIDGAGGAASQMRGGFWLRLAARQVAVREWDAAAEDFVCVDGAQAKRYAGAVARHEFDARLGPYPFDVLRNWASLLRHVRDFGALRRLGVEEGKALWLLDSEEGDEVLEADPRLKVAAQERAAEMNVTTSMRYTPVPRHGHEAPNTGIPVTRVPAEVTAACMDQSSLMRR